MSNNNGGIRYKSRWGKIPEVDELQFKFTSAELERFLRSKIEFVNNELAKRNVQMDTIDPARITVNAIEIGKKFVPLVVTLPPEVLNRSVYNTKVPEIFQNDNNGFVPIKKVYWEMLRRFTFPKRDVDAMRSRNIQREFGVRRQEYVREYMNFATPKILYTDRDRTEIDRVSFLADPNPMIHEMLINDMRPNEKFQTFMIDIKAYKENDSAIYHVLRKVTKRGDGQNNDYVRTVQQIANRISS